MDSHKGGRIGKSWRRPSKRGFQEEGSSEPLKLSWNQMTRGLKNILQIWPRGRAGGLERGR